MEVKVGFKQTEIGVLPEEWGTIEYAKNLNIMAGLGFKKSEYSDIGIRLLRIDNVSYGQITWESIAYLPPEYSRKFPHLMLAEGDILLALNRPITNDQLKIAKIRNEDLPAILYQRVGRISFINDQVDKDFIYHVLRIFIRKFVEESSVGSDQPFISTTKLKKILLPIPPTKAEQKAIAEALNDVDTLIKAIEQLLAKKYQIKDAIMDELLSGKRRLLRFGDPWVFVSIDQISLVTDFSANGSFADLKANVKYLSQPDYAILVRSVDFGRNWDGDFIYVPKSSYDFLKKSKLEVGDLIISNIGNAGKLFQVPDLGTPMTLGPNALVIKTNGFPNTSKKYLYYYLSSLAGQNQIQNIISKTAQPKFNKTDFRNLKIPFPQFSEQTAIAEILSDMDAEITALEGKLSKARQVKQGMMSVLLTGRVRLV